jgi:hypothetical protein
MITLEKLIIFKHFNGDSDGFSRIGTIEQMQAIDDDDWLMIESLLQDIYLEDNQFLSKSYVRVAGKNLSKHCDSQETIQELKRMARNGNNPDWH